MHLFRSKRRSSELILAPMDYRKAHYSYAKLFFFLKTNKPNREFNTKNRPLYILKSVVSTSTRQSDEISLWI